MNLYNDYLYFCQTLFIRRQQNDYDQFIKETIELFEFQLSYIIS